jgi:hypothetical protein
VKERLIWKRIQMKKKKKLTEIRDVLTGEAFAANVQIHLLILGEDLEEPSEKVDQVSGADVEFVDVIRFRAIRVTGAGRLIDEEHISVFVPSGVDLFE